MPQYLIQASYTAGAWANMIKNPQDRIQVVARSIEKPGGKVLHGWLAFGEYDTISVIEMPDNASAAAFAMAISAAGACKSVKTTPPLSQEDGLAAAKKATTSGYQPPA